MNTKKELKTTKKKIQYWPNPWPTPWQITTNMLGNSTIKDKHGNKILVNIPVKLAEQITHAVNKYRQWQS